jgi:hypothetical protein
MQNGRIRDQNQGYWKKILSSAYVWENMKRLQRKVSWLFRERVVAIAPYDGFSINVELIDMNFLPMWI